MDASVLVSTSQQILHVNLKTRRVTSVDLGRTEYYGISWFPGSSELVLSHSGLDNQALKSLEHYSQSEVGYLSMGAVTSERFLSEPHQILCMPDGRVLTTNTGRNALVAIDFDKPGYRYEVRLSDARWDRLSPNDTSGDHINSVFQSGDSVLVLAHRFGKGSRIATLAYPDLVLQEMTDVKGRSGLHNLWMTHEGQLISCLSDAGSLIDVETNEVLWHSVAQSPVYTRGLAAGLDFVVVGESSYASRHARNSSNSGIWIIDRSNWKAQDFIALGPVGPVHEVRLVDTPDLAHHGTPLVGATRLAKADALTALSRARLKQDREARKTKSTWSDFDLVFGMPFSRSDEVLVAPAEGIALMRRAASKTVDENSVSFGYSLEEPYSGGHVGAVLYSGNGADSDMDAFILRVGSDGRAAMSLWTHDGREWSADGRCNAIGLPVRGELSLMRDESTVTVTVDGSTLATLPSAELTHVNGSLGIRWLNSMIMRGH